MPRTSSFDDRRWYAAATHTLWRSCSARLQLAVYKSPRWVISRTPRGAVNFQDHKNDDGDFIFYKDDIAHKDLSRMNIKAELKNVGYCGLWANNRTLGGFAVSLNWGRNQYERRKPDLAYLWDRKC